MPDLLKTTSPATDERSLADRARSQYASLRRSFRHFLTQEKVAASLKTLAWVVPLTFLIWVYAEREQLYTTDRPIAIPIEVTSADLKMIVTLQRPAEGVILVDMRGPRAEVDAITTRFRAGGDIAPLKLVLDPTVRGQRELSTAALVGNTDLFKGGAQVTNCQPAVLQVHVDELQDIDVPVTAPASVTNLASAPIFEPARVRVRAPKLAWEKARSEGALTAIADLTSVADLATPGTHEIPAVRVEFPALQSQPHVSISPATVKVTLEVRQLDRQLRLPYVVIYPLTSANLQKQYRIECQETIPNVNVIGPPDKIALLEQPDYHPRPKAVLDIEADDATGSVIRKRLRFIDLPEGVRVVAEESPREVEFRLVPISGEQ